MTTTEDHLRFVAMLERAHAAAFRPAIASGSAYQWSAACHHLWEQGRLDVAEFAARLLQPLFPGIALLESLVAYFDGMPREPPPLPFSDYPLAEIQIVPRRGADTVLLCFCARNGTLGLPLPFVHQWLGRLPASLVYIKDLRHLSGGRGYLSVGSDRDGSAAALRGIARRLRAPRILTLGVSHGGFPALFYGLLLNAAGVLNIAGATDFTPGFVDGLGPVSREHQELRRRAPDYLLNLRDVYTAALSPPRVHCVYSAGLPRDRQQAERLAGLDRVELIGVDGFEHNVLDPLIRSDRLMPLLQRFVAPEPKAAAWARRALRRMRGAAKPEAMRRIAW